MALAFKREQKTWEEGGRQDAMGRISAVYGKEIPIEVDYESIKGIQGQGEWYSGKPEGNNALALRYLNEQGKWICISIETVGEDDVGKEALREHIQKILFLVTDKGVKGCDMRDIKCFDVAVENKTLKITCNLDFTGYIGQSFPYSDIDKLISKALHNKGGLLFNRMKKQLEDGKLKDMNSRLESSLGFSFPIEVDWESLRMIQGVGEWYADKPEPRSVIGCRYLEDQGLFGVMYVFESIGGDDLGKEAMKDAFSKVVVHVTDLAPKGSDMRSIDNHTMEKKGKVVHITHNLDFTSHVGQTFPSDEMKKLVEAQL